GERGEFDAAALAVRDELQGVVEIDDFGDGPGLRGVVADLVALLGGDGLAAGEAHERVAVGRRHVDAALFGRAAEIFLDAEPRPLRREFGAAAEDAGDAGVFERLALLFERLAQRLQELWRGEG